LFSILASRAANQLPNIYWTNAEFEKGNLSLQSIKWDEAMGKDPFNPDADFNGIPLANARVAARRLKIFGNGNISFQSIEWRSHLALLR
jgi:hypothetical protein